MRIDRTSDCLVQTLNSMLLERNLGRFEEKRFYPNKDVLKVNLEKHPFKDEIIRYLEMHNIPQELLFVWPLIDRSTLSDLGILRHMLAGNIVIHPFNADQLQPNSYDVAVGVNYYRWIGDGKGKSFKQLRKSNIADIEYSTDKTIKKGLVPIYPESQYVYNIYNPFDSENVEAEWELQKAEQATTFINKHKIMLNGIRFTDYIIVLEPHEQILAHTEEFVGGLNVIIHEISGKSSSGRNMTEMCSDANMGNVGFLNRYTLEIANKSGFAIPIVTGNVTYASFLFRETQIAGQTYKGQYAKSTDIDKVIEAWVPQMMLPKMKRLPGR